MVTDFLSLEAYGFLRDFIVDRSYSAFLSFTSIVLRFGLGCPASGNDADNVEVTGVTREDGRAVRPMMNQGGRTARLACRGASG